MEVNTTSNPSNAKPLYLCRAISVPAAMLAVMFYLASFSSAALAAVWTVTGSMTDARFNHTATLLANGKVLVAGGSGSSVALASAELYDRTTGTWTATGSMSAARSLHTATLLANGKVLVAGGFEESGAVLASAELYDRTTGTWTATGSMTTARDVHTATLLQNGEVLVAGGSGTSSALASAELYTFTKDDCKNREWEDFTSAPGPFRNQGQCIQGVK